MRRPVQRPPGHPRRTTAVLGALLALLLAVGYWVVSVADAPPEPEPERPSFPQLPTPPAATPPPGTPQPGADYPVRRLGSLTGRSAVTSGRGNADLRYARMPHNATRVHLICSGCDGDTWLVEHPHGFPVGAYGPLPSPEDTSAVVDVADPATTTDLLVKAAPRAEWAVTLTPFDELPVHETTFDALEDDVVAVRATADVHLTCTGPLSYRTLAREGGAAEYLNVQLGQEDQAGTRALVPGRGTDLLVLDVYCPGRWTVTLP